MKGGMPKTTKKWRKSLKNPKKTGLMCSYRKNSGKFCPKQVSGHFGAKSTNQNHFLGIFETFAPFFGRF